MEPFVVHRGRGLPLRRAGVDTDQIVPAQFCKRISRTVYADALFAGWRADPASVLNDLRYAGASVLLAGPDFGIGSSREHAVWALRDGGFRVVVAAGFADIFSRNCLRNGLLPVVLPEPAVDALATCVENDPLLEIVVDLRGTLVRGGPVQERFPMDERPRRMMLDGLDGIDLTLRREARIRDYEQGRPRWLPAVRAAGPRVAR